jgi:hypothetical protein
VQLHRQKVCCWCTVDASAKRCTVGMRYCSTARMCCPEWLGTIDLVLTAYSGSTSAQGSVAVQTVLVYAYSLD